jgi:hypothetical protein
VCVSCASMSDFPSLANKAEMFSSLPFLIFIQDCGEASARIRSPLLYFRRCMKTEEGWLCPLFLRMVMCGRSQESRLANRIHFLSLKTSQSAPPAYQARPGRQLLLRTDLRIGRNCSRGGRGWRSSAPAAFRTPRAAALLSLLLHYLEEKKRGKREQVRGSLPPPQ